MNFGSQLDQFCGTIVEMIGQQNGDIGVCPFVTFPPHLPGYTDRPA
jgi:hypothetical protein